MSKEPTSRPRSHHLFLAETALVLLVTTLSVHAAPSDGTSASNRLWLVYGDYMTGFQHITGKVNYLLRLAEPDRPPLSQLGLGIGAHGDTIQIWESGAYAWIAGTGTVASTNWRDNSGNQKMAASLQGRKADLVLVQLDLSYARDSRNQATRREKTDKAVAGYVAAAKAVGAKLVFYVLPGTQHTTGSVGEIGRIGDRKIIATNAPNMPTNKVIVARLSEDYARELDLVDAECRRLVEAHGANLAPTHRAFACLRAAQPRLDLHAPVRPDDTHLSPHDATLVALVIARAYLGPTFKAPATAEPFLAFHNKAIAAENMKRKAKGEAEQPPLTLDDDTWRAMLQACESAFASMPTAATGN